MPGTNDNVGQKVTAATKAADKKARDAEAKARADANKAKYTGSTVNDPAPNTHTTLDYSGSVTPAAAAAALTVNLPAGAKVFTHAGSTVIVYEPIPGLRLTYDGTAAAKAGRLNLNGAPTQEVGADVWGGDLSQNVTFAGEADELATIQGSFQEFWDSTFNTVMGQHNSASKDLGVQKIIAQFAARPDMSPSEFTNLLQGTEWFQSHTQDELHWNDLGTAEQAKQRADTADKMAQTYMQYLGVPIKPTDPRIQNYLEDVTSGKMGYGAFTEIVKTMGQADSESPWARNIRSEEEARLQRGVDIEDKAQNVRDIYYQWGIPLSAASSLELGGKLASNQMSDADILQSVQQQAMVLYPWKDPMMDTTTAALPWLETYKRTMEKSVDLMNPNVQSALVAGQPVFEFEKTLKRSDEWMTTKNGQQTMEDTIGSLGRKMGF